MSGKRLRNLKILLNYGTVKPLAIKIKIKVVHSSSFFFFKTYSRKFFHYVLLPDEGFSFRFSFMDQLNFVMVLGEILLLHFVLRFFLHIFSC